MKVLTGHSANTAGADLRLRNFYGISGLIQLKRGLIISGSRAN